MPWLPSTNNSRTTPAHAETSAIVIHANAIGWIIGKRDNKINKMQAQNNMEIRISLTVRDYQDVKITGNANSINNALKEITVIVLCKNFSSRYCIYRPDSKFQHRNNIKINEIKKTINNPMKIFILTMHMEQAMQKYKIRKTCHPTRQLDNNYMQPKL